jgi:ABC-2 type transport system ATP-binding protein
MCLEPNAATPSLPDYLRRPVLVNRRILGHVQLADIPTCIEWAQGLKRSGAIEEYSLGPTTLEDVYIRLVKNPEENANHKEAP